MAKQRAKPTDESMEVSVENAVGVDPHKKTLTATVLDGRGGTVATASFKVSGVGHRALVEWATSFGLVRRWGIENASGLGRHTAVLLIERGHDVRDVCPTRTAEQSRRRRQGKTDALDSLRIAREVQADPDLPVAFKRAPGDAGPDETHELLNLWHNQRRSLLKSRQHLLNEADALLHDLPEEIRADLPDDTAVRPRLNALSDRDRTVRWDPVTALRLRLLDDHAAAIAALDAREREASRQLHHLTRRAGSTLSELCGIADRSDAELLVETGDPRRFAGEGGFAPLQRHRPTTRLLGRRRRRTETAPTQSWRQSSGQRRAAPHGRHPAVLPTSSPTDL